MNELARPTLQVDLDVEIPKIPVLEHNLGVVPQMFFAVSNDAADGSYNCNIFWYSCFYTVFKYRF